MTSTEEFMVWPEGEHSAHFVRHVVYQTWKRIREDRVLGLAAEAGFWALLSLPALLVALFGLLGYFNGVLGHANIVKIHDDVLRVAGDVLTKSTVNSTVAPLVNQILAKGHFEVVSISFLISLWSGSTVMSDYVNTITVAYDMRGLRTWYRSRLVALGLYLGAVLCGLILLPLLALGPDTIVSFLPHALARTASVAIHIAYWPAVGVGSVAVLTTMYMVCLPVRVRWRRNLPGALLGMSIWLIGSFGVRAYLESSFRSKSYGVLASPIATLLFFYVTALAVLVGAELNSAIDAMHPVASTASGRARSIRKARADEDARDEPRRRHLGPTEPTVADDWRDLPGDAAQPG